LLKLEELVGGKKGERVKGERVKGERVKEEGRKEGRKVGII
jgi:hypothetical protein